jgi:hypothetical protein
LGNVYGILQKKFTKVSGNFKKSPAKFPDISKKVYLSLRIFCKKIRVRTGTPPPEPTESCAGYFQKNPATLLKILRIVRQGYRPFKKKSGNIIEHFFKSCRTIPKKSSGRAYHGGIMRERVGDNPLLPQPVPRSEFPSNVPPWDLPQRVESAMTDGEPLFLYRRGCPVSCRHASAPVHSGGGPAPKELWEDHKLQGIPRLM